jgi:hypothetical protein
VRIPEDGRLAVMDKLEIEDTSQGHDRVSVIVLGLIIVLFYAFYNFLSW